jgi:hypothetical protein
MLPNHGLHVGVEALAATLPSLFLG